MAVTNEKTAEDLETTTTDDPPWFMFGDSDDIDDPDTAPTIRMLPVAAPA